MNKKLIDQLSKLDKMEKLAVAEALWDSLIKDPDDVPVPDAHKKILRDRLETYEKDEKEGKTWEEIKKKYL
ncbi:MAG: addiction module protein [Balneolaceae bacterium]|nr:addiction module protein [Balneolaceae bacterium]